MKASSEEDEWCSDLTVLLLLIDEARWELKDEKTVERSGRSSLSELVLNCCL